MKNVLLLLLIPTCLPFLNVNAQTWQYARDFDHQTADAVVAASDGSYVAGISGDGVYVARVNDDGTSLIWERHLPLNFESDANKVVTLIRGREECSGCGLYLFVDLDPNVDHFGPAVDPSTATVVDNIDLDAANGALVILKISTSGAVSVLGQYGSPNLGEAHWVDATNDINYNLHGIHAVINLVSGEFEGFVTEGSYVAGIDPDNGNLVVEHALFGGEITAISADDMDFWITGNFREVANLFSLNLNFPFTTSLEGYYTEVVFCGGSGECDSEPTKIYEKSLDNFVIKLQGPTVVNSDPVLFKQEFVGKGDSRAVDIIASENGGQVFVTGTLDHHASIRLDPNSNITEVNTLSKNSTFNISLDTKGNFQWGEQLTVPLNTLDQTAIRLTLDASLNPVLAGHRISSSLANTSFVTALDRGNGTALWEAEALHQGLNSTAIKDIDASIDGSFYMAGPIAGDAPGSSIFGPFTIPAPDAVSSFIAKIGSSPEFGFSGQLDVASVFPTISKGGSFNVEFSQTFTDGKVEVVVTDLFGTVEFRDSRKDVKPGETKSYTQSLKSGLHILLIKTAKGEHKQMFLVE